jgi:hypothetical protein
VPSYELRIYFFPTIGCPWNGLGTLGQAGSIAAGAWINGGGSFFAEVVGHELGHNFGLNHAKTLSCGSVQIGAQCTEGSEYSDPYDMMAGPSRFHFNASYKNYINWFPPGSIATVSSGSRVVTLQPYETWTGAGPIALGVLSPSRSYWLEQRKQIGFDQGLCVLPACNVVEGALVHQDLGSRSLLLDMTPAGEGQPGTFQDGALELGNVFTDPAVGLTVRPLARTASTLTLRVDFANLDTTAPSNLNARQVNPASILVTWNPPALGTPDYYELARSESVDGPYTTVVTGTSVLNFTDSTAVVGHAYLYKARARWGSLWSSYSNPDPASVFSDFSVVAGSTPVKAAHFLELRTAVDMRRSLVGLGSSWSGSVVPGSLIRRGDLLELRVRLDEALGTPSGGYTDPMLPAGTPVRRIHVAELRNRVN